MQITNDRHEFRKILEDGKNAGLKRFIPVFVSLNNVSRIKALVEDAKGEDNDDEVDDDDISQEDSICKILLKNRFVDIEGCGRLRAMIVFDEADQSINGNVDQRGKYAGDNDADPGRINKKTAAMFMAPRTVGRLEDEPGMVVEANCLFDLFSATLDVTATPHSLFLSGRKLTSRAHTGIITGSPSKHGFQYIKLPGWNSKLIDCMEVARDDRGPSCMIDSFLSPDAPARCHYAAVVGLATRQKVDQMTQALRYAALYGPSQLVTATWSADGYSVFTQWYEEKESSDALTLVDRSFAAANLKRHAKHEMYKLPFGTEWQTEGDLASAIRARAAEGRGVFETDESIEVRVKRELGQKTQDHGTETTVIAEYRETNGSYPVFLERFDKEKNLLSYQRLLDDEKEVFVNVVVFGKDIMDRGVPVKGAVNHGCGLTDMYVNVESHCTLVIQVCGRLCGNSYHKCNSRCPAHGSQVCVAMVASRLQ